MDWRGIAAAYLAGRGVAGNGAPSRANAAEELAQHLEARYREALAAGADEAEARQAALAELVPQPRPPRLPRPAPLRQLRLAARRLRRAPGFTLIAIVSLALGIGASAAIFQLLDAVVLRPLQVAQPSRLAAVRIVDNHRNDSQVVVYGELTYPLYRRIRRAQRAFVGLAAWGAAWTEGNWNTAASGPPQLVQGLWVSGNFFAVLGLHAASGRLFTAADDHPGCAPSAVLSYDYWRRAYGGAPVAGRSITLNRHPMPILGVSPRGFTGPEVGNAFDVALPLCAEPLMDGEGAMLHNPTAWWLSTMGRLRPGWTFARATAQLKAISPALFARGVPSVFSPRARSVYLAHRLEAVPAGRGASLTRDQFATPLWLLLALACAVLLIAGANLANLLLARAGVRRRELAVRLALGASRGSIAGELWAESVWLAAGGAIAGAVLAAFCVRWLAGALTTSDGGPPVVLNLSPDWRVIGVLAGLAAVVCLLVGLAPSLTARATSPAEALRSGGRGISGGGGLRRGLVVAQVALSLALLVTALLFAGTLRTLAQLNPGFRESDVLIAQADLSPLHLPVSARIAFKQRVTASLRQIPGVRAAARLVVVPVSGDLSNRLIEIPAAGSAPGVAHAIPWINLVTPGYLRVFGTPLLAGRSFLPSDTAASPRVAVVTAAFAQKYLHGASPIGRVFRIQGNGGKFGPPFQIVGVAANVKYTGLQDPFAPVVLMDRNQTRHPDENYQVALYSSLPIAAVEQGVLRAFGALAPAVTVQFTPFDRVIAADLLQTRLLAALGAAFALLAVVLAGVGLYGVISYWVVRRRGELGVRLALGASRGQVIRLVLREAGLLAALGIAIGAVMAYFAARAARSLLFGLPAADPAAFAAAAGGLALAALLAAWLPARRAAALDPLRTLREE